MAKAKGHALFTVEHFEAYTSRLVLDSGEYWKLEDFQAQIAESILDPIRMMLSSGHARGGVEVWAILPEGNAKTTFMAGMALYLADFTPLPWIPVGASTRDQAEILAQQAYQIIRMSPGMSKRFRIFEGYRRITPIRPDHPAPGKRGIKVLAADVASGDGVIPFPLAICDEGHRHPDMRLYRLWRGKLLKRGGAIAMISTAGVPGHEFEVMRDEIRRRATDTKRDGAHTISRVGERVTMHEWMVADARRATDMEAVKEANPLNSITIDMLKQQFDSPTTDLGSWMRLKCNIPARSRDAAVAAAEWDDAFVDVRIPLGSHIGLGIDVAWRHDTFAIVPAARIKASPREYTLLGRSVVLVPPRDGTMLHPDVVKTALADFLDDFIVDEVAMDVGRAEEIAAWLEDQGVKVIEWPQRNAQAARDYEAFMEGLRTGATRHNGCPTLRAHVLNAVARPLPGDRRRFDRPTSNRSRVHDDERVIDALAAATFINAYYARPDDPLLSLDEYRIVGL